jgi:hypothetical protein
MIDGLWIHDSGTFNIGRYSRSLNILYLHTSFGLDYYLPRNMHEWSFWSNL